MKPPHRAVQSRKRAKQQPQQCITRSLSNSSLSKHSLHVNDESNNNSFSSSPPLLLNIADAALPWAVAIFSFAIYIPHCPHGVPGGDSGELLAQACQLGIAHPPGSTLLLPYELSS